MNQGRDITHDNRMTTTHATNIETGFIRQSKDRSDVVGFMNDVEIDPEQGFTIKENMLRHDSISSTHLNESMNKENDSLKLVKSGYNEETGTHSVFKWSDDGRNESVTQNSDVIIHTIVRGMAPTISNLFTYNKHNFTAETLGNVAISGSKHSAIQYRGGVKDNSIKELNHLTQTELGQFDHKILSKHPDQYTIFGASRDTKLGDTNTSFEKTITPPKIAKSQLGLGEGGRVSNTDHLEETKVAYIDITEPHKNNFTSLST